MDRSSDVRIGETVQNSEPDLSTVDVEKVDLDTEKAMPPDEVSREIVQLLTETAHQVKTRAGRFVKPVNRPSQVKSFLSELKISYQLLFIWGII